MRCPARAPLCMESEEKMKRKVAALLASGALVIATTRPPLLARPPPTNGGNGAGKSGQCTGRRERPVRAFYLQRLCTRKWRLTQAISGQRLVGAFKRTIGESLNGGPQVGQERSRT